jgi:phage FluMu gp28-like protein
MTSKKAQTGKSKADAEKPKGRRKREVRTAREETAPARKGAEAQRKLQVANYELPEPGAASAATDRRHRVERDICASREVENTPHPDAGASTLSPRRGPGPDSSSRAELVSSPIRLLPYQRRWVADRSSLKMVVKARQIGYSFAATLQALLRCLEHKTTWIFLSKGERQSKLLMEKVQEHIQSCGIVAQAFESSFFEGASRKQLEVRLPNGSVIYGLPSNPDTARGYSGNVTLDEFAFHADAAKIYSALFPTITRGYSLEVISTPNGQQGKFFELAKAAGLTDGRIVSSESGVGKEALPIRDLLLATRLSPRDSLLPTADSRFWSSHWCDVYEAVRQGLKIDIALLRTGCDDESTFQQEFCCQFVSTAENLFSPELLAACLSAEASTDTPAHQLALARGMERQEIGNRKWEVGQNPSSSPTSYFLLPTSEFFLGIDIGRQHDRTVFWLDEVTTLSRHPEAAEAAEGSALSNSGFLSRFSGIGMTGGGGQQGTEERLAIARIVRTLDRAPFAEQLECARELLRLERQDGQPLVRRAAMDATGIGAMLAETLAEEFGPRVEPVTFTAAVKENLAFRTKRRMEKQLSLLPDTPEVRRAFSAVKRVVTPSGNLRFDAVRTAAGHADEFWAKALADLAADSEPASTAADGYLAGGAAIINPAAFTELDGGWGEAF